MQIAFFCYNLIGINELSTIYATKNKVKQNAVNEIATINGSKVLIENGEIKTILSKEIQQTGYMTVEEMSQLIDAEIKALYKMS